MWVELENAEIDQIVEVLGPGRLADKLRERPHLQTGASVKAAEAKANSFSLDLEIEPSGIIEREELGAWVMTWLWVTEKQADVPARCITYLGSQDRDLAQALPAFRLLNWEREDETISARGEMLGFEWEFDTIGPVWTLVAYPHGDDYTDWSHVEEWDGEGAASTMSFTDVLAAIVRSLHRMLSNQVWLPQQRHAIFWRRYLDLYAIDAISEQRAACVLNVDVEVLRKKAQPIRIHIEAERKAGKTVVLAGPGIPHFDIDSAE